MFMGSWKFDIHIETTDIILPYLSFKIYTMKALNKWKSIKAYRFCDLQVNNVPYLFS